MVSFEVQRKNMVESQIRPSDITDRRVIRAMLEVQREAFAPAASRATAYMDQDLLVSPDAAAAQPRRFLLAPRLYAKMAQELTLGERDAVLEIGAASGYGAAILARIARTVFALECDADLARLAAAALGAEPGAGQRAEAAPPNVTVVTGPLAAGWPPEGPYDAILVAGAVPEVPAALFDQLKDGGRLVAVLTGAGVSRVMQWRRMGSTFDARAVTEASAPSLPGFERKAGFVF